VSPSCHSCAERCMAYGYTHTRTPLGICGQRHAMHTHASVHCTSQALAAPGWQPALRYSARLVQWPHSKVSGDPPPCVHGPCPCAHSPHPPPLDQVCQGRHDPPQPSPTVYLPSSTVSSAASRTRPSPNAGYSRRASRTTASSSGTRPERAQPHGRRHVMHVCAGRDMSACSKAARPDPGGYQPRLQVNQCV
jgi:hypothetical protein